MPIVYKKLPEPAKAGHSFTAGKQKLEPDVLRVEVQHGPFQKCGRLVHDNSRLQHLKKELLKLSRSVDVVFVPTSSAVPRLTDPKEHDLVTLVANYIHPDTNEATEDVLYQIPSIRMFNADGTGERCEEAKQAVKGMLNVLNWY